MSEKEQKETRVFPQTVYSRRNKWKKAVVPFAYTQEQPTADKLKDGEEIAIYTLTAIKKVKVTAEFEETGT